VRIELGDPIVAAGIKWRVFALRHRLHLTEHLRGAGLVETDFRVDDADGFEQIQRPQAGDLPGGMGLVETYPDEALGGQIIDFRGAAAFQQADSRTQIGQVKLYQMQVGVVLNA